MITFTARLKDEEAEALTRLAYLHGVSKNRILSALIAGEYERLTSGDELTPPDEELVFISSPDGFPAEYTKGRDGFNLDSPRDFQKLDRAEQRRALRCYDYAIENTDEDEEEIINDLTKTRTDYYVNM